MVNMANQKEKQGYLGDLTNKSTEELRYLLKRQESVAANSKFISRLPDKGAKIHEMIKKIEQILEQQAKVDETADLFKNMAINSERARLQRGGGREEEEEEEEEEEDVQLLRRLANRDQEQKIVVDERPEPEPETKFTNSYEMVIKRAEKRSNEVSKRKFKPNRSINTKDVHDVVGKMNSLEVERDVVMLEKSDQNPSSSEPSGQTSEVDSLEQRLSESHQSMESSKTALSVCVSQGESPRHLSEGVSATIPRKLNSPSGPGRLKHKYDELLEEKLYRGESHCESSKLISVEDSVRIQQAHQHKIQEIHANHAATKLAERLNVKMSAYRPEGSSAVTSRYREAEGSVDDTDSDDDEEQKDYPE